MKTLVSGIQPSGNLTLGNYLGAIKTFVDLQNMAEEYRFFVFIADLHSITVPQDPKKLRENIRSLAAIYLACGLDPKKVTLFIQSEVYEHVELGYLLQTITYVSELERMTQYKDKMQRQVAGVSSALLTYPVLMAADILLYNPDTVPIGDDQKQHVELTRNIAERFNSRFGNTFKLPEPVISKAGARIMSLQDPEKKMSKSDPIERACIYLLDSETVIRKKIASAVTDSEACVRFDPVQKPGVSNLLNILSCCTNQSIASLEQKFASSNYGAFKQAVADAVVGLLTPIQVAYQELIHSPLLDQILDAGRDQAAYFAKRNMHKITNKMGIGRKK